MNCGAASRLTSFDGSEQASGVAASSEESTGEMQAERARYRCVVLCRWAQ